MELISGFITVQKKINVFSSITVVYASHDKKKKNVMKTIENKKQRIKRFSWRFIWIKLGINVLRSKYDSIGTNFRVEMSIKYW